MNHLHIFWDSIFFGDVGVRCEDEWMQMREVLECNVESYQNLRLELTCSTSKS